jgi:hypothetical protein
MVEISALRRERGEKFVSDNSKCIRVRGLTSNFLCGGGMDVFWNGPIRQTLKIYLCDISRYIPSFHIL